MTRRNKNRVGKNCGIENLETRRLMAGSLMREASLFVVATEVGQDTACQQSRIRCRGKVGLDLGDAPDSYGTLLASDGPSHVARGSMLGVSRDVEGDGQPSPFATKDDTVGIDDEDGLLDIRRASETTGEATIRVTGKGKLNAWIDFNGNGKFDHPSEQIFRDVSLSSGTYTLTFDMPSDFTGLTYLRMRFNAAGGLTPLGSARDGEVEDYCIHFDSGRLTDNVIPTGDVPVDLFAAEEEGNSAKKNRGNDSDSSSTARDASLRDQLFSSTDFAREQRTAELDDSIGELSGNGNRGDFPVDSFFDIWTEDAISNAGQ